MMLTTTRTVRLAIVAVVGSIAFACAFAAVNKPPVDRYFSQFHRTQVLATDVPTALDVVRSALDGMGYEVASVNTDLGLVRTKVRPALIPAVCDCGSWNSGKVGGTGESVLVVSAQRNEGGGSTVEISHECHTTFTGRNLYGAVTRQETYRCASTGAAENEFWATLTKVLSNRERKH